MSFLGDIFVFSGFVKMLMYQRYEEASYDEPCSEKRKRRIAAI